MTLQETALILGKSESTLLRNFQRTQENLRKKGIILSKNGSGKDAEFFIVYDASYKQNQN